MRLLHFITPPVSFPCSTMRRLIPLNISQLSVAMMVRLGLTDPLAKRLWEKKTLWLIVMHQDDISKVKTIPCNRLNLRSTHPEASNTLSEDSHR